MYGQNIKMKKGKFTNIEMKLQSFKKMRRLGTLCKDMLTNIAGGTTDPEIDSVTWMELGNNMAPLTLVANLATIWRNLHR